MNSLDEKLESKDISKALINLDYFSMNEEDMVFHRLFFDTESDESKRESEDNNGIKYQENRMTRSNKKKNQILYVIQTL